MSHRDPVDQLCSMHLFKIADSGRDCVEEVERQRKLYAWANRLDISVHDVRFSELVSDTKTFIGRIPNILGIIKFSTSHIDWVYSRLGDLKTFDFTASLNPPHHPVTLMHTDHKHTKEQKVKKCANFAREIKETCPTWYANGGTFAGS